MSGLILLLLVLAASKATEMAVLEVVEVTGHHVLVSKHQSVDMRSLKFW